MSLQAGNLTVRLAEGADDLKAAQRLRYDIFVKELGGDGPLVDHDAGLEADRFDPFCDHLLLLDQDAVVGAYRVMRTEGAQRAGQFYCSDEYDLTPLTNSGRKVLELGRSCVAAPYRGGMGLHLIWQGLAAYVQQHDIEILFGVASFHGTDPQALAPQLSLLYTEHLAPSELRARARVYQPMDLVPADQIDRRTAMQGMPALIKAYLRLGGVIGDGAFVDHAFNTTDVMMIMDTQRLNARMARRYTG